MKQSLAVGIVLITAAACARLIPHPPNVTPVIAMALVGGMYLDRKTGFIVPLAALFLSDIVLGFHGLMTYVYGSIMVTVFIGMQVQRKKNALTVVGGSLLSSILFFGVTNAGVWLQGGGRVYPMTFEGLLLSYTLAIPFFRNAVFGDLFFVGLLAGLFEFSRRYVHANDRALGRNDQASRDVVKRG